tara:strand:- start:170 stop:412 length:243 start_codon:yes stop_codon:yes gene_type:complete
MKKNSFTNKYNARIVCDDGSTFLIGFPHKKRNIYLTVDLTNNPLYLSPKKLQTDRPKGQKAKQSALQFDFYSLINEKKSN